MGAVYTGYPSFWESQVTGMCFFPYSSTPLHLCIKAGNKETFGAILSSPNLDIELPTSDGETSLWLALNKSRDFSLASQLLENGASPNSISPLTGDSALHLCALNHLQEAGLFLIKQKAKVNIVNKQVRAPKNPLMVYKNDVFYNLSINLLKIQKDDFANKR